MYAYERKENLVNALFCAIEPLHQRQGEFFFQNIAVADILLAIYPPFMYQVHIPIDSSCSYTH